ncbi:uncharacterized protein LOC144420846 [Styela clava]
MKSQTKFNMCSEVLVEISRGEQDWTEVRECLVRAFHHYSLYKYLIPNEQTRPEFLRRYLEAIYDVTIRNGNSILLVGRLSENNTIIGGVMVVPPSKEYGGWECEKADDFYEAYEKYKLREIDLEAFVRMENHSKRAVQFHLKNGFQSVADIPYYDENTSADQDNSQFNATVLMMDPLNADRIADFKKKINFPTERTNNIETGLQMTHISVTAESHLIHNSSITSIINMYDRLKITRNRG